MAKQSSKLRKEVEQAYTLSDQLHVQLQVLGQMKGSVRVQVKPSSTGDVETLAFLVMMQATKAAQDDLRAILEQMQLVNEKKQRLRKLLENKRETGSSEYDLEATFQLVATLYAKQLEEDAVDTLKGDLDSISEMGEMESLRLQMAMDRLSKLMTTLSNLLKKISDTSSQIVQNLK